MRIFFSKALFFREEEDLFVAISSSGNFLNIVNSIEMTKKKARVITFSGFGANNKICGTGDANVCVLASKYGMVESIHNLIL